MRVFDKKPVLLIIMLSEDVITAEIVMTNPCSFICPNTQDSQSLALWAMMAMLCVDISGRQLRRKECN